MYRRQRSTQSRLIAFSVALLVVLGILLLFAPKSQPTVSDQATTATAAGPSPSPEASPTPTPPAVAYPPGTRVRTTETVNLRSAPGLRGAVLSTVAQGAEVVVIEGPQDLDGFRWWKIRTASTPPREGWMADNWWEPIGAVLDGDNAGAG